MTLFLLALFSTFCLLHILSFIFAKLALCAQTSEHDPINFDGVSLVRPLCGLEPFSRETLLSTFQQDFDHKLELIFCVAQAHDPIIPLVQQLIAEHPLAQAKLLIGEDVISSNPKLNNIVKGWYGAQYDIVIFADSNLLLRPDYVARVCSTFTPTTLCVSAPPVGTRPIGFWGDLESAMLNSHAARWQYAASFCGINFAQGKTLAFQRPLIKADMMAAMAREPAEDAATTKFIEDMGGELRLLSQPYEQPIGPRSFASYWGRHSRWARLRRSSFPALFVLEIALGICAPLLCLIALMGKDYPMTLAAVLGFIFVWYGAEYLFVRALHWPMNWRSPLAWLLRDLLIPALTIAAWARADFTWHGHRMSANKVQIEAEPVR